MRVGRRSLRGRRDDDEYSHRLRRRGVNGGTPRRDLGASGVGRHSISVKPGLIIDVDGTTVSGDMGSSIPLDPSGGDDGGDDDEIVSIHVTTVSGDVRISRA